MECHYFQTYEGHKDGVWEVSTSKHVSTVLGTASAGMLIYVPIMYLSDLERGVFHKTLPCTATLGITLQYDNRNQLLSNSFRLPDILTG
jgi:hypothetical protein